MKDVTITFRLHDENSLTDHGLFPDAIAAGLAQIGVLKGGEAVQTRNGFWLVVSENAGVGRYDGPTVGLFDKWPR